MLTWHSRCVFADIKTSLHVSKISLGSHLAQFPDQSWDKCKAEHQMQIQDGREFKENAKFWMKITCKTNREENKTLLSLTITTLNSNLLTCKEEVNAKFCWEAENNQYAKLHNFFLTMQ